MDVGWLLFSRRLGGLVCNGSRKICVKGLSWVLRGVSLPWWLYEGLWNKESDATNELSLGDIPKYNWLGLVNLFWVYCVTH